MCKTCKILSHLCNECNKIYNDCKCCLKYVKVANIHFIFQCQMYEKQITVSLEYCKSKLSDLFDFCDKDLTKFVLLLRKRVMCYEYIDSWQKLKEKSLPPKEKF